MGHAERHRGRPHVDFIHEIIGADRIIRSVHYPYPTLDGTREFIEKLPVGAHDREKITHLNAETCSACDVMLPSARVAGPGLTAGARKSGTRADGVDPAGR